MRVDYIYVSDGIRVRDFVTHDDKRPGTDRYPSDHYPLSATIELPPDSSSVTPVSRNLQNHISRHSHCVAKKYLI